MKRIFAIAFGLLVSWGVFASETYDGIPQKFIGLVEKSEFHAAIDALYGNQDSFDWSGPEGLATKNRFAKEMAVNGDCEFHELLMEEKIGERIVTLIYTMGMKERPVYLSIKLYKPENDWFARSFSWNVDLSKLLDEQTVSKELK
ncbi:MAG TPA: hypothetical protein VJA19_12825 [Pseudomonas sp.]|nr:hypothetical protein [Pseudomonas sp.]